MPVILRAAAALATGYRPIMGLALAGRRKRRSNLLPADLSFARITDWSKLIGITHRLAAKLRRSKGYFCSGVFLLLNRVQMRVFLTPPQTLNAVVMAQQNQA